MAVVSQAGSYPAFALGMFLAGSGAGILNGETAKTFFAAIPVERSGIASGLGTTTRFAGLLIAVAIVGAILSHTNFTVVFFVQAAVAAIAAVATYRIMRGLQIAPSIAGAPAID
jgi:sugar phosphate permease